MPDVPITVASGDGDRVRKGSEGTVGIAGCAATNFDRRVQLFHAQPAGTGVRRL